MRAKLDSILFTRGRTRSRLLRLIGDNMRTHESPFKGANAHAIAAEHARDVSELECQAYAAVNRMAQRCHNEEESN